MLLITSIARLGFELSGSFVSLSSSEWRRVTSSSTSWFLETSSTLFSRSTCSRGVLRIFFCYYCCFLREVFIPVKRVYDSGLVPLPILDKSILGILSVFGAPLLVFWFLGDFGRPNGRLWWNGIVIFIGSWVFEVDEARDEYADILPDIILSTDRCYSIW